MRQPDLACDICRDLIPLVRDGVASEASRRAVEQHLAGCAACRAVWQGETPPPPDDRHVLSRLRRQVRRWMGALLAAGLGLGLVFSGSGEGLPWNTLVMPVLGALFWFFGGRHRRLLPLGTAAVIGLFNLVELWAVSLRNAYDVPAALWNNAGYALIIAVFCLLLCGLGMLAAALIQYGFARPAALPNEPAAKERKDRHEK